MLLYRLNIHVVEVEMSACVSFSVAYLLIVYRTKRRGGRRYISLVVDHWLALRTHLLSQALTTALAPPWRGLQFRTFRSSREHEKRLRETSTLPPLDRTPGERTPSAWLRLADLGTSCRRYLEPALTIMLWSAISTAPICLPSLERLSFISSSSAWCRRQL